MNKFVALVCMLVASVAGADQHGHGGGNHGGNHGGSNSYHHGGSNSYYHGHNSYHGNYNRYPSYGYNYGYRGYNYGYQNGYYPNYQPNYVPFYPDYPSGASWYASSETDQPLVVVYAKDQAQTQAFWVQAVFYDANQASIYAEQLRIPYKLDTVLKYYYRPTQNGTQVQFQNLHGKWVYGVVK